MGVLSTVGGPVILVGDFNSGPGRPPADGGQATYDLITAFGFGDAWMTKRPATQDGFTCCHAGDLSNRHPNLTQRIDVVFSRGVDGLLANAALVGSTTGDWAARGVWPSDHAGVTARWVVPAW
jgi:endonuclease/exonuclease/phosphatase family metal-dependent hydrolase